MLYHTREENQKYGEVDNYIISGRDAMLYTNGREVVYNLYGAGWQND